MEQHNPEPGGQWKTGRLGMVRCLDVERKTSFMSTWVGGILREGGLFTITGVVVVDVDVEVGLLVGSLVGLLWIVVEGEVTCDS